MTVLSVVSRRESLQVMVSEDAFDGYVAVIMGWVLCDRLVVCKEKEQE